MNILTNKGSLALPTALVSLTIFFADAPMSVYAQNIEIDIKDDCPWVSQINRLGESREPRSVAIRSRLIAYCLDEEGREEEAIRVLEESLNLPVTRNVDLFQNQSTLARLYERMDKIREAESLWLYLLRLYDGSSDIERRQRQTILFESGSFYVRQGRIADAKDTFLNVIGEIQGKMEYNAYLIASLRALVNIYEDEREYEAAIAAAELLTEAVEFGAAEGLFSDEDLRAEQTNLERLRELQD